MENTYYLAIDIGASSGRHILASMNNGKIELEEVYRFENGMTSKDGKKLWDTKRLFKEILQGMKECQKIGKVPKSMSIDTWAVDYVLLDENDNVIGDVYGYRDNRTETIENEVYKIIDGNSLYARTGIQKQKFNTIYQLMADKYNNPDKLNKAKTFLMLPDYFQFLLTGKKASEYTNATSTQLVSPITKQWDYELIEKLGYPKDIFLKLSTPKTELGELTKDIQSEVGFNTKVIMCASHDTASAVMAMPNTKENGLYISSGTWSLMGTELKEAKCDDNSRSCNFTNEGGIDYRFRYLKNIMGLWIIQSVRHEYNDKYSFAQLCDMASECHSFPSRIDVNDESFLAPESMIEAIKAYCKKNNSKVPESVGEIATVVYKSLAESYKNTVKEIEDILNITFDKINVIGGGANAGYLNQLTANAVGKQVVAGPTEATAIGNIMAQMMADKVFDNLISARECVRNSFEIKEYESQNK